MKLRHLILCASCNCFADCAEVVGEEEFTSPARYLRLTVDKVIDEFSSA
jgi:hypothetical protein